MEARSRGGEEPWRRGAVEARSRGGEGRWGRGAVEVRSGGGAERWRRGAVEAIVDCQERRQRVEALVDELIGVLRNASRRKKTTDGVGIRAELVGHGPQMHGR